MPPKDIQEDHLIHYVCEGNRKWIIDGEITRLTDEALEIANEEPEQIIVKSFPTIEFVLANPLTMSHRILLLTGKWPSNNWLKMHGYRMRRRVRK